MGVKDLWGLVSPLGEVLPLNALQGTTVAIDLAPWVVDSQKVNMGRVTRPHLRNLLWRTLRLLNAGVLPLFVLEGEAPSLKWDTIRKRNQQNFGHGREPAAATAKTGKRSQFKRIQKECGHLLDLLGVPWVQAIGEAEATCAALNYHQVVSGVITQDNDVFLYGGETVFRNFSANQSNATVEKFCMSSIEEHLGVNRSDLLVLSLLLGCDYLPGGIPNVGKETAIRMIREWYQQGVTDSLDRICKWTLEDEDVWRDINAKKWKSGSILELEAGVRKRALETEGFPFVDIIKEYKSKLRVPNTSYKWRQPQMKELLRWCIMKLEWEADYALDKIAPVVSRWIMMNISPQKPVPTNYVPDMQAQRCVKKCVRGGVASMVVEWHVVENERFECSIPAYVTTDEPIAYIREAAPHLIEKFEDQLKAKKKGKSSRKKKTEEVLDNGITSINLNAKVENRKTNKRKPVKLDTEIKPITNYLQAKTKIKDIPKEQKEKFKTKENCDILSREEHNIENDKKEDHPWSLQDKTMSRVQGNLPEKKNPLTQSNVKIRNNSSKNVETLSDKESPINEVYDMQSFNDDDLAELSGIFRKLEMVDECQINKVLNSKDEQHMKKCKSPTNKIYNLDSITQNNESFINDDNFNESIDINNISEIISRISEAPISEKDKDRNLHLNETHSNKKITLFDNNTCVTNLESQIKQKVKEDHSNLIFSKKESHEDNVYAVVHIGNENKTLVENCLYKSIKTLKNTNPTLNPALKESVSINKVSNPVNSMNVENCCSKESQEDISSDNINGENLSSDQSNYMEESWQDEDNEFELSMIINRITGMEVEKNYNSSKDKSTNAINTKKSCNPPTNENESHSISDKNSLVCLKVKSKTKINTNEITKTNPESSETHKQSENGFKNTICWKYFTPISERQDDPETFPNDKILCPHSKNESNSLHHTCNSACKNKNSCNKIEIDISKEIKKHSQEHLKESLKQQVSSVVNAENMAAHIIRSSLKNSCELSEYGKTLSDSILAEAADCISFNKSENSRTQMSFELFEKSCDSRVNIETVKVSSKYKLANTNKGITPYLPKHHSTPAIGCIAPRRPLNCRSHSNIPNLENISQENDLALPSPLSVSSPAQISFMSDHDSPFPLLSTSNDKVNESSPCTKKGFNTPVRSKATRDQVINSTTSKSSESTYKSNLPLSRNDDHQDRKNKVSTMEYQCKNFDTPKPKVQEQQVCFKLFDTFNNSGLNLSTSLSKIQSDSPSKVMHTGNCSPKWAPTDCDSMSILFPNVCLGNEKFELVPEVTASSSINKEERKPLKGLMGTEFNIDLFHNKVKGVKDSISQEAEKVDLQKKKSTRNRFMNLKGSHDLYQENELHINKGKENKEIVMNKQILNNDIAEKEKKKNSISKYSDMSTFSPFIPSQYVSLGDRLKAKYRDKAMDKLIDQM